MKLSLAILIERLGESVVWSKLVGNPVSLRFGRPDHLVGLTMMRKDHLYVASPGDMEVHQEVEPDACVVVVGKYALSDCGNRSSIICVTEQTSLFILFNEIQSIFDEFDNWEYAMQECVNSNGDLQDIVDVSNVIFGNPIFISDANYRVVAETENSHLKIKYNYIPERCLIDLRQSRDYEIMWEQGVPSFSFHDFRHLSLVVRSQGLFAIFVSLMESDKKITEGVPALLQHMSKYLLLMFERGHTSELNERNSLANVVRRMLSNQPTTSHQLQAALSICDWEILGTYRFFCIELPESDRRFNMVEPHQTRIEEVFGPHGIVFEYNQFLCVLLNSAKSTIQKSIDAGLQVYLRTNGIKAGMSIEFSDVAKVRNYYVQARDVLEVARRIDPAVSLYSFQDYSLDLVLRNPHQELSPEFLGHFGLTKLWHLDQERQTQYVRTLKAYFESQFNVTLAAKALFIHRTTFIDRLAKIQEILELNLRDYKSCLYAMISLYMLDFPL